RHRGNLSRMRIWIAYLVSALVHAALAVALVAHWWSGPEWSIALKRGRPYAQRESLLVVSLEETDVEFFAIPAAGPLAQEVPDEVQRVVPTVEAPAMAPPTVAPHFELARLTPAPVPATDTSVPDQTNEPTTDAPAEPATSATPTNATAASANSSQASNAAQS